MKNVKRVLALFTAMLMLIGSTAMAMPDNTIIIGEKGFSTDLLFEEDYNDDIQAALDASDGGMLFYSLEGVTGGRFLDVFTGTEMTQAQKDALGTITYINADGTETQESFETPITVISADVVNATTITVTFSDGVTQEFIVGELQVGDNDVTISYEDEEYDVEVYLPAPEEIVVEAVTFENYRHFSVRFSDLVDHASAEDASNYYFEIVDGDAAYGYFPTLQESNQLSKIETTYADGAEDWWNGIYNEDDVMIVPPHIEAYDSNGKTVVDIYLPEDARFTTIEDPWLSGEGLFPVLEDDERTLSVLQQTSKFPLTTTLKLLTKETVVNVAVRNIKDAEGNLSIDTAVKPMTILDTEAPTLEAVNVVEANLDLYLEEEGGYGSLGSDLGTFNLACSDPTRDQCGELLGFVYSEPVYDAHFVDLSNTEPYRNIKLYVNGKQVAQMYDDNDYSGPLNLHEYMFFNMSANATYNGARTVILDVEKLVKDTPDEVFATGKVYHISMVGVTDLAGNIEVESQHEFDVIFEDIPTGPIEPIEAIIPEVKEVVQVADNMFRIQFNRENVKADFVIENPDGEGFGTLEVAIPSSDEDGISYVSVPAFDHEPVDGIPTGVVQNEYLAYNGQDSIYRDIRVEDIWVDDEHFLILNGDDEILDNMKLVNDVQAPVANDPDNIAFEGRGTVIEIPIQDVYPWDDENIDYWVSPIAYVYNFSELRFENEIVDYQYGADTYLPITVSYIDADGAKHEALISNYDLRPYWFWGTEFTDKNLGYPGTISYDYYEDILSLDLSEYPQLLEDGLLVEDATYTIEIPSGYFTDSPKDNSSDVFDTNFVYNDDFYDLLYVDEGRDDTNYFTWWFFTSIIDAGLGFTSQEQVVTVDILEQEIVEEEPEPTYIPQTSKQLITYDEPSNSMKIEFTGEIDVTTLKDKANYTINGKTLVEWDAELGTDTVIDYIINNADPDDVRQYAMFEIPQDSIKQDGDYPFKVEGVSHPEGGTMTPVETVIRLRDNSRPVVVEAEVTGDATIKLTFNEPIQYFVDSAIIADPHSTANNFSVKVGNQTFTPDTAVLPDGNDREVILTLGNNDILALEGDISVEIVEDSNENILVIDLSTNRNPMKEDIYFVERP